MARRKRDAAIIFLKCTIIGFCASNQQAAFSTEMMTFSMPGSGIFGETVGGNVGFQLLGRQLPESDHASPLPKTFMQPDLVTPASQAVGGYVLLAQETKNADAPVEPQAVVQETKSADVPAEPQAVMREIKSTTRLSGSKQRRRKPKMAGVPVGTQAVAQGTEESGSQAVVQGTEEPGSQAVVQGAEESGSQAIAQKTEEPESMAVAQETEKVDGLYSPMKKEERLKIAEVSKRKYGMAPIRWGVKLSETVSLERHLTTTHLVNSVPSSSQSRGLVHTQTAEVHADTFILKQYLAQVKGTAGVVSSKSTNGDGFSSITGRTNQLYGEGILRLFPKSRFPFTMSLGATDTRDSAGLVTNKGGDKHLSMDQRYTPLSKARSIDLYHINYQLNTVNSTNPLGYVTHQSAWRGDYRRKSTEHDILTDATYNDKLTSSNNDVNRGVSNLTVSDKYLPVNSLLSLYSFANLYSVTDNSVGNSTSSRYLQAYTNATWQPESEDLPLFVDGSVRLFRSTNTSWSVANSTQSLSGSAGASYVFSSHLTGRVDTGVTIASSNKPIANNAIQGGTVTTQRATLNYSGDAIKFWNNSAYSWHASSGAANQTGSAADRSIFGGVGQNLFVPYVFNMLNRKWRMGSRFDQSLDTTLSRVSGLRTTLSSNGIVGLSPMSNLILPDKGELMGGYGKTSGLGTAVNFRVHDVLTMGKQAGHLSTYHLELTEKSSFSYARSGLDIDVSFGAIQSPQGSTTNLGGSLGLLGATGIKYTKSRVFGVLGLDYTASLNISKQTKQDLTHLTVDPNWNNPTFPWAFDQNLRYKIGRNEVLLRGLISDQFGVKSASLWLLFRAWRTIGN